MTPPVRVRVYVAGPYTRGDAAQNVAAAMRAGDELMDGGFYPLVPHLTHFMHMMRQRAYKEWLALDDEFLRACHAVVRLPGMSDGADAEVSLAHTLGIPVYRGVRELLNHRIDLWAHVKDNYGEGSYR